MLTHMPWFRTSLMYACNVPHFVSSVMHICQPWTPQHHTPTCNGPPPCVTPTCNGSPPHAMVHPVSRPHAMVHPCVTPTCNGPPCVTPTCNGPPVVLQCTYGDLLSIPTGEIIPCHHSNRSTKHPTKTQ